MRQRQLSKGDAPAIRPFTPFAFPPRRDHGMPRRPKVIPVIDAYSLAIVGLIVS